MRRQLSRRPQLLIILAVLATSFIVVACGGAEPIFRAAGSTLGGAPDVTTQSVPEVAAPPVDQAQGLAGGTTAGGGSGGTAESTAGGPMIIRTGTMDLQVGDVDRAVGDATAVVTKAPKRFAIDAIATATRGESACVEIEVATALAAS